MTEDEKENLYQNSFEQGEALIEDRALFAEERPCDEDEPRIRKLPNVVILTKRQKAWIPHVQTISDDRAQGVKRKKSTVSRDICLSKRKFPTPNMRDSGRLREAASAARLRMPHLPNVAPHDKSGKK